MGLSLFKARELQEGDLSGTANALTARDYQYRASVDYYYAEDKLFHRPVEAPDGTGLSLDLSVKWQPHENLRLSARVVDLLGAIQCVITSYSIHYTKLYEAAPRTRCSCREPSPWPSPLPRPLIPGNDEMAWSQNRRVQFAVWSVD